MNILNINVNDFGGPNKHREKYKKDFGDRYISEWDKLDKGEIVNGIFELIQKYTPDVIIMQEYDVYSREARAFTETMTKEGYKYKIVHALGGKRPSITVMFIKECIQYTPKLDVHDLNGRAFAIELENFWLYGVHVPPKFNEKFWKEMEAFLLGENKNKLLIGDFNTVNLYNSSRLNTVLKKFDLVDEWIREGNHNPISVPGDYVIVSKQLALNGKVELIEQSFSDHPAFLFTF